ncbi:hypothetical protein RQP46_010313 [Phenoliferia psychrophenolica]
MPTEITSLAPETLGRIFELGAEDEAAKAPFLLATSLVCRAWRHESQARLWHTIYFVSKENLDAPATNIRVVDSPALGRFVTVRATFLGPLRRESPFPSDEQISRIILSLRGLSRLIISFAKIVDFADVTPVPFQLKSLHVYTNVDAPVFVESVIATSQLRRIEAGFIMGSDDLRSLMKVLPAHSSDLENVTIGYGKWSPEVFATFASLSRLAFVGIPEPDNFRKILANIPSPLHSLCFEPPGDSNPDRYREIVDIILDYLTKPVFKSLESLVLPQDISDQTWLAETGFMRECDSRGIEVEWED